MPRLPSADGLKPPCTQILCICINEEGSVHPAETPDVQLLISLGALFIRLVNLDRLPYLGAGGHADPFVVTEGYNEGIDITLVSLWILGSSACKFERSDGRFGLLEACQKGRRCRDVK